MVDDGLQDDPRLPRPCVRRPLVVGQRNLEAAGAPDRRVRDLPIATDLVAGIGDHDPAVQLIRQDRGRAAQHGGLPRPRPAHHQDVPPGLEHLLQGLRRLADRPPDPKGKADDLVVPVADARDPMQGAVDAGSVVLPESRDPAEHILQILPADLPRQRHRLVVIVEVEPRRAAQVQFDLFDGLRGVALDRRPDPPGDHGQEGGDFAAGRHRPAGRYGLAEAGRPSRPANRIWKLVGTTRPGPCGSSFVGNNVKIIST